MSKSDTIKCDQCGREVPTADCYKVGEKCICDDCYISKSFRVDACDPLAVRSAGKFQNLSGDSTSPNLTKLQKEIYDIINSKDRTTSMELMDLFHISDKELQTQLAILRHFSLIKGQKEGRDVYFTRF